MITPEEVLLIFRKWQEDRTPVFCTSSLSSCWGISLRGLISVDKTEVRLESSGGAVLILRLGECNEFLYDEPNNVPLQDLPEEVRHKTFLVASLPGRVGERRDKIAFVASD